MLSSCQKFNDASPDSKFDPVAVLEVVRGASKMTRNLMFLGRIHCNPSKNMKMNGHRTLVGELLLNRFGQTDMPGLSTP